MRGRETFKPADVFPEIVASVIVALFVGAALYRWLFLEISGVMLTVLAVTVLSAVAAAFGVDRLEAAVAAFRE